MAFEVQVSGNDRDQAIVLRDTTTGTTAEIYRFGALLNGFSILFHGRPFNVVDGFASPAEAATTITPAFKSAKLSPFTCRLHQGRYSFAGTPYTIEKFYLPPHAIHGIIYDAVYDIKATHANETAASVTLQYHYAATDAGYPFAYDITVQWELKKNNALTVTTTLEHQLETAIPVADGWHPYFKLDTPVDNCTLEFDSAAMLEFDETLIPTGKVLPDHRFTEATSLNGIFLDNCFVLDPLTTQAECILSSRQLKLTITPAKSYPYLQVYTPEHRQSIAIENLSAPPDAFNNGIGLLLAEKNKPAIFSTTYRVETI
jgi:aldose 1-epimerase